MHRRILTLAVLLPLAPLAGARAGPALKPVAAAERLAAVARLAEQLQAKYVLPDATKTLATALRAREAAGAYAAATNVESFSDALGQAGHFNVVYAPGFESWPAGQIPTADQVEEMRQEIARQGYGIESVVRCRATWATWSCAASARLSWSAKRCRRRSRCSRAQTR